MEREAPRSPSLILKILLDLSLGRLSISPSAIRPALAHLKPGERAKPDDGLPFLSAGALARRSVEPSERMSPFSEQSHLCPASLNKGHSRITIRNLSKRRPRSESRSRNHGCATLDWQ
ncbi:hypothetical protein BRAS3843_1730009 [Bradyrhizobium sp. STM 3843]|nr:hypothetical protein BRAS3843_1730009 [Bradyrhizobium sp. STM 3843]